MIFCATPHAIDIPTLVCRPGWQLEDLQSKALLSFFQGFVERPVSTLWIPASISPRVGEVFGKRWKWYIATVGWTASFGQRLVGGLLSESPIRNAWSHTGMIGMPKIGTISWTIDWVWNIGYPRKKVAFWSSENKSSGFFWFLTSMMNRLSFTSAEIGSWGSPTCVQFPENGVCCYTKRIKFQDWLKVGRLSQVKAFSCRHPLPFAYWEVILFQKIPSVPVPVVIFLMNLINSNIFAQRGWLLVIWSWISTG